MPSHITHMLFGKDAVKSVNNKNLNRIIETYSNIFNLGCQGPDIFYHNRRTRPSGIKFGILLHHERYGRFVSNYLRVLGESICLSRKSIFKNFNPEQSFSFILGFITHALLDRRAHPFITFFSGWVDPTKPETKKYFMCHAFFERIIDVLLLKEKLNTDIQEFDFFSHIYCGNSFPETEKQILFRALRHTFPETVTKNDTIRIENAYLDSMHYYDISNPIFPKLKMELEKYDFEKEVKLRRLALLHPIKLDKEVDFLNNNHIAWSHPCDKHDISNKSFIELYNTAIRDTTSVLKLTFKIYKLIQEQYQRVYNPGYPYRGFSTCRHSRKTKKFLHKLYRDLNKLERKIGNHDLDTPRPELTRCTPKYSRPLPLGEILDRMYSELNPINLQKH